METTVSKTGYTSFNCDLFFDDPFGDLTIEQVKDLDLIFGGKKTKIHEELQENIGLIGRIDFAKSELEEILEYDPNGWNPYPKVLPPEGKSYLVQVFDSNIEKNKLWVLEWSVSNQWWCCLVDKDDGFNFVAFRELPELYKPEAQE